MTFDIDKNCFFLIIDQKFFAYLQKPDVEVQNGNIKSNQTASERNNSIGDAGQGMATPGLPTRSRPASKMTKYVECWGADKPFANIAESTLAKNIELTVSIKHSCSQIIQEKLVQKISNQSKIN